MNKIIKSGENYTLILADGSQHDCGLLYEKKTEKWHVVVPKEAREACGRTYIRVSHFDDTDTYEFEDKTEHRIGTTAGGWRSKMTDEERAQVEAAEALIERIKAEASARKIEKPEKDSEEAIEAEIAKLKAKLAKKQAEKAAK